MSKPTIGTKGSFATTTTEKKTMTNKQVLKMHEDSFKRFEASRKLNNMRRSVEALDCSFDCDFCTKEWEKRDAEYRKAYKKFQKTYEE